MNILTTCRYSCAYQRWYDLEQRAGERLLLECGVLSLGPETCEAVVGTLEAAQLHGLPVESYDAAELRKQFPQFQIDDNWSGVLERDAGLLFVERCVAAHARQARIAGAELHENEEVLAWRSDAQHVEVVTKQARYAAERLVITAGAYSPRLLKEFGVPLTIMRQVPVWFGVSQPEQFRRDRFPCFCVDIPEGFFYGFPMLDPTGVKVARHYGATEHADPSAVDWQFQPDDEQSLRSFVQSHLPGIDGPASRGVVCMYTLTPDRHFVIDVHPQHTNVVVAAGFSGHGFKFASVVGEVLADLCDRGNTDLPIQMFRAARFGGTA